MRLLKQHMGVSKNNGTPKWMVYKGKPYEQMDDLGVFPYFWKHPYMILKSKFVSSLEVGPTILTKMVVNLLDDDKPSFI